MTEPSVQATDTKQCECGGVMRRGTQPTRLEFAGLESPEFLMPGFYCQCGEGLVTGVDMRVSDRVLAALKAQAAELEAAA